MKTHHLLIILVCSLSPMMASASPFCITVTGMAASCIYDDTALCRTRAAQMGGVCTVNTEEITSGYGTEKFCLVDSSRVPQCIYVDRTLCENAQNNGSVCVNNTFHNMNKDQPDPFAADPNRNY